MPAAWGGAFTELVSSIEAYGASVLKPLGIDYRFERHGNLRSITLSAIQAFNVYLIFKEAMTNIVKHARAARVDARAALEGGLLSIVVEDDGRGMTQGEKTRGHGRMNIKARADELGASLVISRRPEGGTRVALSLHVDR